MDELNSAEDEERGDDDGGGGLPEELRLREQRVAKLQAVREPARGGARDDAEIEQPELLQRTAGEQ
jgi:hypothetical protein